MIRDEALMEAFAAELKARRAVLGWSQEELAHRARINRTFVAKLELAKNQPTLGTLHQLALALNTRLPELFTEVLARYDRSRGNDPAADTTEGGNLRKYVLDKPM